MHRWWAVKSLVAFLGILNLEPVQWPVNYQDKLVYLEVPFPADPEDDPSFMLNEELLGVVEMAVGKFLQRFNGIRHLELDNLPSDGLLRQLNNALVNGFTGRLNTLDAQSLYGGDLVNFSENLTSLTYLCNMHSFPLLPSINPLVLKKLHLSAIPLDFSWSLFQGDPVDFPNLVDLSMDFTEDNAARITYAERHGLEIVVPDNQVSVRFPKLRQLEYSHITDGFVFEPQGIPSCLDSVDLAVSWKAFSHFSKLPISSIGRLNVVFSTAPDNTQECHRAANRLFSDIENVGRTRLSFYQGSRISLEHAKWKNIGSIVLERLDIRELICMVCNMPQVGHLDVGELIYRELDDDMVQRLQTNVSRLGVLKMREIFIEGDVEDCVKHLVLLLRMLRDIREVWISQNISEEVKTRVQGYPRLKKARII